MSKLTAVAYYAGIPLKNNNPEKPKILDNFLHGVKSSGDIAIAHRGFDVLNCDVALIQGFVHEDGKIAPHLQLRSRAIELQKKNNKKSLIVDSNLFLYRDTGNTNTYLRYSFDGVFPNTGFYFDQDVDPDRWKKISKNIGISLKDYRNNGDYILICLQRNGGWSMRGLSIQQWVDNTIQELKKYTSRPIIIRPHPGDKKTAKSLKIKFANVRISQNIDFLDDIKKAWATVVYNSSPGVASIIEGVPVFLTDPFPEHSQSFEVANLNLNEIESPKLSERQQWIERLSMCHWNFNELRSGEAWNFFKKYIYL
jgi:hypothetical protein